jgi:hypothetical protein
MQTDPVETSYLSGRLVSKLDGFLAGCFVCKISRDLDLTLRAYHNPQYICARDLVKSFRSQRITCSRVT